MEAGKVIINVDESVIAHTINRNRGWLPRGKHFTVTSSIHLNLINIIAAIGSDGSLYYTVNRGKTNSWSFMLFMIKLVEHLNAVDSGWRSKTVIMMDNAQYHRGNLVRGKLMALKVPFMYLGPYHFNISPIELFFSFIKGKNLNPLNSKLISV
jgi:hypothetical protein